MTTTLYMCFYKFSVFNILYLKRLTHTGFLFSIYACMYAVLRRSFLQTYFYNIFYESPSLYTKVIKYPMIAMEKMNIIILMFK